MPYLYEDRLRTKLTEFFKNNPTDELTYGDIAIKFGFNPRYCERVVNQMRKAGELEFVRVIRVPEHKR